MICQVAINSVEVGA